MTDKIMEQIQATTERHRIYGPLQIDYRRVTICEACSQAWPCDAIQLAQKLELAVKALEDAKTDLDVCAWLCERCDYDPRMKETDLYDTVSKALAAIAEVK